MLSSVFCLAIFSADRFHAERCLVRNWSSAWFSKIPAALSPRKEGRLTKLSLAAVETFLETHWPKATEANFQVQGCATTYQ